jgi:hypothetical protein
VLTGRTPLLAAAALVKRRARLLRAYHEASSADLAALGRKAGVAEVWDRVVVPNLD